MNISEELQEFGLVKYVVNNGGALVPLVIPAEYTKGTGLMNPSIFNDNGTLLVNIRHINYTLYHSETKKFQHQFGIKRHDYFRSAGVYAYGSLWKNT